MFLLDTDHISIIQWSTEPQASHLAARMRAVGTEHFLVSIVTFQEQVLGWNAYLNRAKDSAGAVHAYDRLHKILLDFANLHVAAFDDAAAGQFDRLKAERIRISTMDLRIAATCLAHGYTLLSRNLSDFRKVPGLRVEDWARSP